MSRPNHLKTLETKYARLKGYYFHIEREAEDYDGAELVDKQNEIFRRQQKIADRMTAIEKTIQIWDPDWLGEEIRPIRVRRQSPVREHQSKLINYFNGDYTKTKIEKDINNFLKKISKNKKYKISKRDKIFIESLRSDGINIEKKYSDFFNSDMSEIPTDIQVMINNDEKGTALLRLAEIIGQDKLERIDDDTIYFIISTLNQLKIDVLRNRILLKVLPLKV